MDDIFLKIIVVGVILSVVLLMVGIVWAFLYEGNAEETKPSGCFKQFIVSIFVVIMILCAFKFCHTDNSRWKPRHTYIQKPSLNNVNTLIFNSLELYM